MSDTIAFPIVTAIAIILVLLPFPWHWNARNYGTLLYIAWTFLGCLIYFVNSIVWAHNLNNPHPVWCDISTKLSIGLSVALPAVSLCINRRLYNIATMKHASSSPSERRKQALSDVGIGLGIPISVMILHYVVQGHRYNIIEDIGCVPVTYSTPPAIPLVFMWAPLLGFISLIYAGFSIFAFLRQRRNFSAVLNSNNSHLNVSRYLRLVALAGTDVLLDLPLSLFFTWFNTRGGLQPWISWADTHYDFSDIDYISRADLDALPVVWVAFEINRWALPVAAILFFLFFGLAGESLASYKRLMGRVSSAIKRRNPPELASGRTWTTRLSPYRRRGNALSGKLIGTITEKDSRLEKESSASTSTSVLTKPNSNDKVETPFSSSTSFPSPRSTQVVEFTPSSGYQQLQSPADTLAQPPSSGPPRSPLSPHNIRSPGSLGQVQHTRSVSV